MRQRAWMLLFTAGLCAIALPGCAACDNFLLKYFYREPPPCEPGINQERMGPPPDYFRVAEEAPAPPVVDSPYHPYLPTNSRLEGPSGELPPGQRVLEFTDPPPVLAPRALPEQNDLFGQQELQHPNNHEPPSLELQDPLVLAMDFLLKNKPDEALKQVQRCSPPNQEMYMRLLSILVGLHDTPVNRQPPNQVSILQNQLYEVGRLLRAHSDLIIDTMCLCERIDGFGQYTRKRDGYAYKAGIGKQWGEQVNVYLELRNMTSELRDHYFTTNLNGKVTILDNQGMQVWTYNYRKLEKPLLSLMPRFDCYRSYDFFVPAMPPGKYTLTMEIVDETCQPYRVAQKSVEFNVAAP
jgi:hypothetical protein